MSGVLLLHLDGVDGATSATDDYGHPITFVGNAQLTTAQKKYGSASLRVVDTSDGYVSAPAGQDWAFGSGDWTMAAWVRWDAVDWCYLFGQYDPAQGGASIRTGYFRYHPGEARWQYKTHLPNGTSWSTSQYPSTWVPTLGVWHHVALVRQGNNLLFFVDGILLDNNDVTGLDCANIAAPICVGACPDPGLYTENLGRSNVWIDDALIDKGTALWTAPFTPPAYSIELSEAPITITVSHTTEQSEAPISVLVIAFEQSEAPITVNVIIPPTEQTDAPITITVSHVTEISEALIRVLVSGTEQSEAPIAVAVTDGWPTVWAARVVLDGVEVTDRVTGAIRIRMEEGAARIASLALVPTASPINPIWYVGKPVSVDFVHGAVPLRIFTGRVDLPSYDPDTRIVALSCTDDLQNRVAALTRVEIDALTGGGYHRAVHGEIDDNWDYAQACMLTHAAALDASPHGGLRVTPWDGLPVWRTFGAVLDDSMGLDLPRRQDIVNRVNVRYDYRYHRLRERSIGASWHMAWFLPEAEAAGFQYPTAAGILSALGGAGWTVRSAVFYPCPAQVNYAGGTVKTTGDTDSMAAVLGLRYGQTVTETASLTVTAPESIAGNGEIAQDLRCTLASEWSPDEWESDWSVSPTDVGVGQDHAPDADRADAEAGMASALAQAQALILSRHRNCRVAFDLPLTPALDVDRAVAVDAPVGTGRVQAGGKVWAVEHILDPDAGSAISRVTLALSGVAAAGLATPTVAPLTPPEPPDIDEHTGADAYGMPHLTTLVAGLSAYQGNVGGWIIQAPEKINVSTGAVSNPWYSAAASYPETGFRVLLDGVPDSHRQPLEIATAQSYEIAIPDDPLVMM